MARFVADTLRAQAEPRIEAAFLEAGRQEAQVYLCVSEHSLATARLAARLEDLVQQAFPWRGVRVKALVAGGPYEGMVRGVPVYQRPALLDRGRP